MSCFNFFIIVSGFLMDSWLPHIRTINKLGFKLHLGVLALSIIDYVVVLRVAEALEEDHR